MRSPKYSTSTTKKWSKLLLNFLITQAHSFWNLNWSWKYLFPELGLLVCLSTGFWGVSPIVLLLESFLSNTIAGVKDRIPWSPCSRSQVASRFKFWAIWNSYGYCSVFSFSLTVWILDDGRQDDTFILDFEKAFDTPPHELLKCKLYGYGIGGKTLK